MRKNLLRATTALIQCGLAAAWLCACPPPPVVCDGGPEDPETCPAPGLPDDVCNSKEEAFEAKCLLALGTSKEGYITTLTDGSMDRDWYGVQLGALTPRSLLHINAGYTVPQTAVNFSVNVLKEDGSTVPTCTGGQPCPSSGVDKHGASAPKPVDLVLPFSESNAKLLLLVGDEGGTASPRVDNRNPYRVLVEVLDNPDTNEPNDTTPTVIPLTPSGGISQGTQTGYLATNDDIDKFTFDVATGGRQVIYVHVSTARALNPPTPFRVAYSLYDPDMTRIAEDRMDNEFLAVDLSTAKLAPKTGTYTLIIQGYRDGNAQVVKGDTRPDSMYSVDVRVMPDLDTLEPNDTMDTATIRTLGLGTPTNLTGRLSTIPDDEWFALDLPPNGATTVLRYKLTVSSTAGRFAPTSPLAARQLRITNQVTQGATTQDRQVACKTDKTLCPKGQSSDPSLSDFSTLVDAMCTLTDPPQCLLAERNEEPLFTNLKNLEGSLPIPPHTGTSRLYLVMRDLGRGRQKYADDQEWTIRLSWEANPADTASPIALGGSTSNTDGTVAWGFGRILNNFDLTRGDGIRGPSDYEAFPTDLDTYQYSLPATTDQSWSLSWDIIHPGAGGPAGELSLEVAMCQGAPLPDGGCGGSRPILAYSGRNLTPWYLPTSLGNATKLFDRTTVGDTTTITLLPVGCWCVPAATASTGRFFVTVGAANRVSSDPLRYRLKQSVGAYPQSYTGPDGGTFVCPVVDGGCRFGR